MCLYSYALIFLISTRMPCFFLKHLILFIVLLLPSLTVLAEENYQTDIRYLYVQSGQTLHNIVRRLYPERKQDWKKLRAEIVRLNPHAFSNGDETKMKAGVKLTLPQRMVIRPEVLPPHKRKQVGEVVDVRGQVLAVDARKISRGLKAGEPVFLGDKLITGEDGYLRLKMIDRAILDLRCYSIMVIEDYAIKTGNRRSILNLLQGSLRKVTGTIGKVADDVYELRTPVANIGVRGTEYALRVFQSKGCGGTVDADDGLYLEVIKGLVDVHNSAGHEVVAKGDTAYVELPSRKPVKKDIDRAILEPHRHKPVEQEESTSLWWWLLGIALVAVAL